MKIKDIILFKLDNFDDERGSFLKIFSKNFMFKEYAINFKVEEYFFSISKKNVIRGMHFQSSPYEQAKIIYVSNGCITDVLLDLRKDSNTYLQHDTINLSSSNKIFLYIHRGIAHGFLSNEDNSVVNYLVDNIYYKKYEAGILWNSFGYKWCIDNPIISKRDNGLQTLDEYLK